MARNKSFDYQRKVVPINPSTEFIMRKDPLLVLNEHSELNKSGCITLSDANKLALDKILGNQDIGIKVHTIYRISSPVLTERFRESIMKLIYDREFAVQKMYGSSRRTKTGSLETLWSEIDIGTTKHHIIPSNRNGADNDRNYVYLPEYVHRDLHRIFYTYTPIEQIAYLLLLFYNPENIEFTRKLRQLILSQNQVNFYRNELLKKGEIDYSCFPQYFQLEQRINQRYSLPEYKIRA